MANLPLVAAVHDMSGFGRCSLTVAIPILSVMGIQCCPLPTALLSNHTGYPSFFFTDYTQHMEAYYKEWLKLDLDFEAIYSGFLGSEKQVQIVIDMIGAFHEKQRQKGTAPPLVLVDPVMGDNGHIYTTYTPSLCSKMRELVSRADMITPNLTETCLLLEEDYQGENLLLPQARDMAKRLADMGPATVVITGIKSHQGQVMNLAYEKENNRFFTSENPLVQPHYNGTGDVFASVLCGAMVNGLTTQHALEKAAGFVYRCASDTAANNGRTADGVMIEKFMKEL